LDQTGQGVGGVQVKAARAIGGVGRRLGQRREFFDLDFHVCTKD